MPFILAKKLNMTQVFTDDGEVIPVTVLQAKKDQQSNFSDFEVGTVIHISGKTKGRGFAGAVKRHGFHGAPASHGHDHPRAVGSIGQRFPQHVRSGLRMAGRMGGRGATVKNSVIVAISADKNLIFVKGGVPGSKGTLLKIRRTDLRKDLSKIQSYEPRSKSTETSGADEAIS